MEIDWVRVCSWRLLVGGGDAAEDIASLTGIPVRLVEEAVDGRSHAALPGAIVTGRPVEPRCHRARLELRRGLDLLDRSGGPTACWRSRGWQTGDGRAGRGSSLLGTTSLARQVLMVTSDTLDPDPDLVAAHACHQPLCANPRCLDFVSFGTNNYHRRLERLRIPIPPRDDADIRHLDVLDRRLVDLELLALLERYTGELTSGGVGHEQCLVRAGTQDYDHYTTVHVRGRNGVKLHRLMLEAAGVEMSGRLGLHGCDFRPCCRLGPAHVRPGTAKENSTDAKVRGRLAVGGRHGRSIYSDADVIRMRRRFANGEADVTTLQRHYGGHEVTLLRALRAQSYRDVRGAAVDLPVRRRLTDCGAQVVRALIAVGVGDRDVADKVGLSHAYVRDLAAGIHRAQAGGVLTRRPGPARGRLVATGTLTSYDQRYIVERVQAGIAKRQIGRDLGVHARTVDRVWQQARQTVGA